MQANRFRLLAHGLVLLTIAFASCSDGDEPVGARHGGAGESDCGACAGEDSGGSGEGGSSSASGGTQSIRPEGGSDLGGVGGTISAGSGSTPGGDGGGGADGPVREELSLCDRLIQVPDKNLKTTKAFELSVYSDCRVKWLADLYLDAKKRDDFLNDLLTWNQKFWGCQGVAVDNFALVWGTPPLSRGDADLVVGYYLTAAIEHLDLTANEEQEMREALQRLSTLVVTSAALEPSKPQCPDPNGGAGGQDGSGGAAGGGVAEAGLAGSAAANGGGAP
jgi:hypothetical protein